MLSNQLFQQDFSIGPCRRIEHVTNVVVHLLLHTFLGNMFCGILLKMKLSSLTRNKRKYAHSGGLQTNMIVADDQLQAVNSPGDQRLQELTPMHLRFRESHTHTQHAAATTLRDPVRNQQGTAHRLLSEACQVLPL